MIDPAHPARHAVVALGLLALVTGRAGSLPGAWIQWAIPAPGGAALLGLAALGVGRRWR